MQIADHHEMLRCSVCSGFAPLATSFCPHCGKDLQKPVDRLGRVGVVASTLLGSAFTMTLMACYGCPPSECTGVYDYDAGRTRSDAQVNKDSGADLDANASSDAGGSLDAAPEASPDAGDQGDASFDAAPE